MGMEERLEAGWATDTLKTWSPEGSYAVGPANGGVVNVSFVTGYSEFEEKHGHGEGSESNSISTSIGH